MTQPATAENADGSPQPAGPSRWTDVGAPTVQKYGRLAIEQAIRQLDWQPYTPSAASRFDFFDKTAIMTLITGFNLPGATHVAARVHVPTLAFLDEDEIAVFGLETRYDNGTCRIYAADTGANVIILADHFTPYPNWNAPIAKETPDAAV